MWNLIADDCLREKISSWTVDYSVAMSFKGGVPPEDGEFKGVIVRIERPEQRRVVVNLDRLYMDGGFVAALVRNKASISRYSDGAGRWRNSQREVVMEIESVSVDNVCSLGGYSSKFEDLVEIVHLNFWAKFGREASPAEIGLLQKVVGPAWIDHAAVKRVLSRMEPHVDILKELKRLKDSAVQSDRALPS